MAFSISDTAKNRIRAIRSKYPDAKALRIGLRGGGCSGYSYVFEFDTNDATDKDKIIEIDDLKIFIDKKSYFYLSNTELDFVEELMGQRFVFNNPEVTSTCGCGESVSF